MTASLPWTAALLLALSAAPRVGPPGEQRIRRLDGTEIRGRIVRIDKGRITLTGPDRKNRSVALITVESIHCNDPDREAIAGPVLILEGGDTVPLGGLEPGAKGGLRPLLGDLNPPEIPLERIRAFRCRDRAPGDPAFWRDATGPAPEGRDLLYLLREGRAVKVAGTIGTVTSTGLTFDFAGKERTVPFERVYGAVIARTPGRRAQPAAPPPVRVVLADGGHLGGTLVRADRRRLELRHPLLGTLPIAWEEIGVLECARNRMVDLSRVKPVRSVAVPAFDRTWPVSRDRTVDGNPLSIRGKVFERGLCLIPARTLTWKIPRGHTRFLATFGIADETRGAGAALFEVLADGRKLYGRVIRGTDPPQAISLDLGRAKRLTLRIGFGPRLHLGDHCIIAAPRLISPEGK